MPLKYSSSLLSISEFSENMLINVEQLDKYLKVAFIEDDMKVLIALFSIQ